MPDGLRHARNPSGISASQIRGLVTDTKDEPVVYATRRLANSAKNGSDTAFNLFGHTHRRHLQRQKILKPLRGKVDHSFLYRLLHD